MDGWSRADSLGSDHLDDSIHCKMRSFKCPCRGLIFLYSRLEEKKKKTAVCYGYLAPAFNALDLLLQIMV